MAAYIDLHAHVLPGIDDGPDDLEEALAMLRAAADSGIATIAATPHLRADFPDVHVEELAERCEELRTAVKREQIDIRLVGGAEVSLVWALQASDTSAPPTSRMSICSRLTAVRSSSHRSASSST